LGWDIVALGRKAAGEVFEHGRFTQTIRLSADGELLWTERTRINGGDALLQSPVGLAGNPVFGCLWAYGPLWSDTDIDDMRAHLPPAAAVTRLAPRLLLARALGATTAVVREALQMLWQSARPLLFAGRVAIPPRIWST
jgi:urease accessory protein